MFVCFRAYRLINQKGQQQQNYKAYSENLSVEPTKGIGYDTTVGLFEIAFLDRNAKLGIVLGARSSYFQKKFGD